MSGHSKWHNIQQRKGKSDAQRASIFTKIGRELAVAVKSGGPDPNTNSKLRDAIAKAKSCNMPNDNIARSIKKASGEGENINYEEIVYEGYGAGGVAFIVEALTDNKNRTAADVRHLFDKFGGSLGATGCVSYLFKKKGIIVVDKNSIGEDELMLKAIEAGAEDFDAEDDEVYQILTAPQDFSAVRDALEKDGVKILEAKLDMLADVEVNPTESQQQSLLKLIEKLEENDDVQNVYHNAVLSIDDEEIKRKVI
jgi:YebC/PmpR family DNA-binding regulatory protein